jgi:hypothetical protein
MTLTIELTPGTEGILRRLAAQRGMGPADVARTLLEQRLEAEEQTAEPVAPSKGAELVAYWRAQQVVGAWADRTDITDSAAYARELRHRCETRLAE